MRKPKLSSAFRRCFDTTDTTGTIQIGGGLFYRPAHLKTHMMIQGPTQVGKG